MGKLAQPNLLNDTIVARGKIFELVQTKQADGRVFESARRAPGVRLIICDKTTRKVLLSREFRQELNNWDYRLPGGKVFDTLEEYDNHRGSGDNIEAAAISKAIAEGIEEVGIEIAEPKLYRKSTLGATVEWDLYIFEASFWHRVEQGSSPEAGEQIEGAEFFSYDEIERMILTGKMQEDRVALILLQWIYTQRNQGVQDEI